MDKVLKTLFDLQKFNGNAHLAALVKETQQRYDNALSDDELEMVNAAGELFPKMPLDTHEDS